MAEKYGTGVKNGKRTDETTLKSEKTPDISMRKNENKGGSKIAVFFMTIIAVLICSTVVITLDRRNRVYNEITSANAELATLESENVRIRSELDAKVSLKNVEEYAENVLHMKKIDNSQIEYIKIQNSDIVSVPEQEDNIFAKVGGFIDKCMEYLKG